MPESELTSKERLVRALTGHSADVVPAAPAYLSLFLADFERAFYVEQYRRRLHGRSRHSIDHSEDTQFRAEALFQSYGIFKARPDWLEIRRGPSRAWAEQTDIVSLGRTLYYEDKVSGRRVPMHLAPLPRGNEELSSQSASAVDIWDTSGMLRDESDVDQSLPILTSSELLARGDYDLAKEVLGRHGHEYFVSTILDTPFSNAYDLLGFQGLMVIQHDRPTLLHYLLQRHLVRAREEIDAWASTGLHGVYVEEVFTGADMISPGAYDEFVYTYNQPYFQHMSAQGLLPIHYVCGDVLPRLERIAELEIAAVATEESKKNFRIELQDVVDRVAGRMAVFGNIDAVRFGPNGTLGEMAREVKRQARLGAQAAGFVASTGSPFPLDTNPRLIDTLVDTAHAIPA